MFNLIKQKFKKHFHNRKDILHQACISKLKIGGL